MEIVTIERMQHRESIENFTNTYTYVLLLSACAVHKWGVEIRQIYSFLIDAVRSVQHCGIAEIKMRPVQLVGQADHSFTILIGKKRQDEEATWHCHFVNFVSVDLESIWNAKFVAHLYKLDIAGSGVSTVKAQEQAGRER
ncbi:hypothetical protein T4B_9807 [Trichinella pseudospiralis]|uniref:Uncharacterized protein n=1 Tax=Trichinella pseudospiralis TaxID=6337 RepID=A0A0V1JCJ9_TRIPS|nr:hypothetical protein T4B_9807 [Trichinella pseudospiralis]